MHGLWGLIKVIGYVRAVRTDKHIIGYARAVRTDKHVKGYARAVNDYEAAR